MTAVAQKLRTAAVIAVTDGSLVVAVDYVDAVASVPVTVERVFEVDASLDDAWRRLADVQRWPEWAPHITAATVSHAGVAQVLHPWPTDDGPVTWSDMAARVGIERSALRLVDSPDGYEYAHAALEVTGAWPPREGQ